MSTKYALGGPSEALKRLVTCANAEPPKAKRVIFLVVRCRRCLQHTTGGDKREYSLTLPAIQWTWLQQVKERSRHATVGKTIRIIVDFYRPICDGEEEFERCLFAVPQQD